MGWKTVTKGNKNQRGNGITDQVDRKKQACLNTVKSPFHLNKWDGGDILGNCQTGQEEQDAPAEAMRGKQRVGGWKAGGMSVGST
jgi:hypothetical protein